MQSVLAWLSTQLQTLLNLLNGNPVLLAVVSLVVGLLIGEGIRFARERLSIRKELKANQDISLEGTDWIALWQAAADGELAPNFENITIKQSGSQVWMWNEEASPDNPKGGYKWKGKLEFSHGETLMGKYYAAKEENSTSRGIMYFTYDASRKIFLGRWVGKAIDGPFSSGFVVITKSREDSQSRLDALLDRAGKHPVNIISMDFLKPDKVA